MVKTKGQINGHICENKIQELLKHKCRIVLPLKKGADFICIDNNRRISFIEAKYCKSNLTSYQRRVKKIVERFGFNYEILRCPCPI